jgi:hypothetical protein
MEIIVIQIIHLKDIVYAGDMIMFGNNSPKTVSHVDYTTNGGIVYLTSNLTHSFARYNING